MDFLGIGPMELVVIIVIGLLVLGPQRMVSTAQQLGKLMRDIQRSWRETVDAVSIEPSAKKSPSSPQPPPESAPPGQVAYEDLKPKESTDPSPPRESQG